MRIISAIIIAVIFLLLHGCQKTDNDTLYIEWRTKLAGDTIKVSEILTLLPEVEDSSRAIVVLERIYKSANTEEINLRINVFVALTAIRRDIYLHDIKHLIRMGEVDSEERVRLLAEHLKFILIEEDRR